MRYWVGYDLLFLQANPLSWSLTLEGIFKQARPPTSPRTFLSSIQRYRDTVIVWCARRGPVLPRHYWNDWRKPRLCDGSWFLKSQNDKIELVTRPVPHNQNTPPLAPRTPSLPTGLSSATTTCTKAYTRHLRRKTITTASTMTKRNSVTGGVGPWSRTRQVRLKTNLKTPAFQCAKIPFYQPRRLAKFYWILLLFFFVGHFQNPDHPPDHLGQPCHQHETSFTNSPGLPRLVYVKPGLTCYFHCRDEWRRQEQWEAVCRRLPPQQAPHIPLPRQGELLRGSQLFKKAILLFKEHQRCFSR